MSASGRLVVLSGPSCIGKSPLVKALAQFHPDLHNKLKPLVLYNSCSPRPGEKEGEDYHFRRREEIENLRERENFVVMEVPRRPSSVRFEGAASILEERRYAL
jgi:guanylate kinase